jgi:hypothetical protein
MLGDVVSVSGRSVELVGVFHILRDRSEALQCQMIWWLEVLQCQMV